MTDKEFFKKLNKTKRHFEKKYKDSFKPECLNLKALCEHHNRPEYFTQIRNRVYRAAEQTEELCDYILLDLNDLENIYLDADGIIMFREILSGYFDLNELSDIMVFMRRRNEMNKFIYDFKQALKTFSNKQLKEYKQSFTDRITAENKNTCEDFIRMIQAEIDNRHFIIKRTLKHS